MSDFIIHGIPGSPYVRSVLLVLEEKGLDYRLDAMAMGGHRTPEYRLLQPFGRIPAFEHAGFKLYETQAILRYVDRIAPEPALTPGDARRAARMDQLLNITDCYVLPQVTGALAFPRMVAPRFGLPFDEAAIPAAMPTARIAVGEVARLLGDGEYLTGDTLSLADLHMVSQLSFLPHFAEGREVLAPHANLLAWIERMEARPSMKATGWERLMEQAGAPLAPMPAVA